MPVDGGPNAACGPPGELRAAMLARVNAARSAARACGARGMAPAPRLAWSQWLALAARRHAADMAANDFVAHAGSDGARVDRRAERAGYDWRAIGENVGAGAPDVARAVERWLGSPGHCRNLMSPDYADAGAACVTAPGTRYETYWTLVLGEPR